LAVTNGPGLIRERSEALRAYHKEAGVPRAEVDISGGVDSGCVLGVAVIALGAENITAVHSGINTNPEQTARARALCKALGVKLIEIDLTGIFSELTSLMFARSAAAGHSLTEIEQRIKSDPTILGSIRSTLRAPVGRGFNRLLGNGIRHGTGNKCEDEFLRFFQKGGDGEVDSNCLEMLSKVEIWQLAYALGEHFPEAREVYRAMIRCKPSADLWGVGDEHNDETEIKGWLKVDFTYGQVDAESGAVLKAGTIDRVSQFIDTLLPVDNTGALISPNLEVLGSLPNPVPASAFLFNDESRTASTFLTLYATRSGCFDGFTQEQVEALLNGAKKAERATRHKSNATCPLIGHASISAARAAMVSAGLLTNKLPVETSTDKMVA
jgi:NH3-dependent NAD+ synthetase